MNEKANVLIQMAKEEGASGAIYLDAGRVVLDPQFREICRSNSCGRYGRCYTCPPDIGELDELMNRIRQYPHAMLYQTVAPLEDSFDFEGMMEAGAAHSQLGKRIHLKLRDILKQEYFHLASGCRLCETCAKVDNLPCRHPDLALLAMEGCGVDVYQTVKDTQLKYINGVNTVTYFGLILFTE